jgi:hypothetical protein
MMIAMDNRETGINPGARQELFMVSPMLRMGQIVDDDCESGKFNRRVAARLAFRIESLDLRALFRLIAGELVARLCTAQATAICLCDPVAEQRLSRTCPHRKKLHR